jgi:hypothetical protein
MTRRKPETCRQNQGRFYLLGQACRVLGYWVGGDRLRRKTAGWDDEYLASLIAA